MVKLFCTLWVISSCVLFARFTSVDPKREFVNSYSYTSNNPINLIDPDGHQVTVHRKVRNGKRDIVTVHMHAKLVDDTSGRSLKKRELRQIRRKIVGQFRKSFKGKGQKIIFKGRMHLSVASDSNKVSTSDHVFRIVDQGAVPGTAGLSQRERMGVLGRGLYGQKVMWLTSNMLGKKPASTGPHAGTGRSPKGEGTFERTSAHEAGHSMRLVHPGAATRMPKNLMNQTGHPDAGLSVTEHQVLQIERNYLQKRLNGPRQN